MSTTSPTTHVSRPRLALAAALVGVAALAGCNSNDKSPAAKAKPAAPAAHATVPPARTTRPAASSYNPKIDPASFTHVITNRYFPLEPGTKKQLKGAKDGTPQLHTTNITRKTRTIMGVKCVVVKDVVTSNGALVEVAYDWYSQDAKGNVWYFGESSSDYEKGVVTSTHGSWEAGVDGAKPGIVMPAHPKPGPAFYTEFRPGVAEDKGQVLKAGQTATAPAGTFKDVIVMRDTNPLDPTLVQHKFYAPGVGVVKSVRTGSSHTETSELVKRAR